MFFYARTQHDITVKKIAPLDPKKNSAKVIKITGKIPEQYPDRDDGIRLSSPPDGNRHPALKHCAITEQRRQFQQIQNSHRRQLCGSSRIFEKQFSALPFQKSLTSEMPGASRFQSSGISFASSSQLITSTRPPFFSFWVQ